MNKKNELAGSSDISRSHGLDNLRTFMIMLVIYFHGALAYSIAPPWWMVKEPAGSFAFDLFMVLCDTFMMPACFLIAGYFAIPSLKNNGTGKFFLGKLKRLGVPLITGLLVINPVTHFITVNHRQLSGPDPFPFKAAWFQFMEFAAQTSTGVVTDFYHFSWRHFWFIQLLLYFFIAFAVYAALRPNFKQSAKKEEKSMKLILAVVFIVSAAGFYFSSLYTHVDNWAMAGPFFMYQPSRLLLYGAVFLLGVRAWKYQWFQNKTISGSMLFWISLNTALLIITLISMQAYYVTFKDSTLALIFLGVARTAFTVSMLCALLLFFTQKRDHTSPVRSSLARASFHMYIVHFPVILVFQKLLLPYTWPHGIKFLIVGTVTALISWAVSTAVIQRGYRYSTAALVLLFFGMYFFL